MTTEPSIRRRLRFFSKVFDEIVADLDLRIDADREKAAKIVMRLAHGQTGSRRSKDPRRSGPVNANGRRWPAQAPILKP